MEKVAFFWRMRQRRTNEYFLKVKIIVNEAGTPAVEMKNFNVMRTELKLILPLKM